MLRPGATPPKREAASLVASFDEPASVKTLENANKVQLFYPENIKFYQFMVALITRKLWFINNICMIQL